MSDLETLVGGVVERELDHMHKATTFDGSSVDLARLISSVRQSLHERIEPVVLSMSETAWRKRGAPREVDPVSECVQGCGNGAVTFWLDSGCYAACESCRTYWRIRGLNHSVRPSPSVLRENRELIRHYAKLERDYWIDG